MLSLTFIECYLGIGSESNNLVLSPISIPALGSVPLKSICCGAYHTIALSVEGKVYTWGEACNGKLGDGKTQV